MKTGKASKKQDMVFNEDSQHMDEGPIGKPQSAGIEGLGGDKNGYPTGMGAGAEPLGVFENEDTPIVDSDNQQQNIDDKSNSFSEPSRNIADNEGESRGGSNLMAQAVSMSNNLKDDLNSPVNIQGDGEIGKFVLNAQRSQHSDGEESANENMIGLDSKDPSFTGAAGEEDEAPNEDRPTKRHLAKQKSNRKKNAWKKPFKQLQKKQH